jgi:hypothetical protein
MWPKMLLELLPHLARLMPAADKYLANRSASDQATELALGGLREDVRGQLGRLGETQAGLHLALKEQSEQVAQAGLEATRARMAVESVEARVGKLEKTADSIMKLLVGTLVLLVVVAALVVVLLVKAH